MKRIYFWVATFCIICMFASCSEDVTKFEDYDRNWFALEDDPSDPAAHAAYEFYQEYGIPVFDNNVIGEQERKDVWGNTYIHQETLTLNYSMGGMATANSSPSISSFTLCDKAVVPSAIQFIKNNIMPLLPKGIHIQSFLLVESMKSQAFGDRAFKGLNTIVIANASKLATMEGKEKTQTISAIMRAIMGDYILNNKDYKEKLEQFYNVSRRLSPEKDIYNMYKGWLRQYVTGADPNDWQHPTMQEVGFLGPDPSNSYYTPSSTWMDFNMYLESYYNHSAEEFEAEYQTYPYIMEKYNIVKSIITSIK